MNLEELYNQINLQPDIVQQLKLIQEKIEMDRINPYLEQLLTINTAAQAYDDLCVYFKEDTDNLNMLYCQLEAARRVYEKYQEKQIPKFIYTDTMKCFPRFISECKEKNGRAFFDRGWWTYRQTSMNLFRIGELEYQFKTAENKPVIAIHIPSDADLSAKAVDQSLQQAHIFFNTYYHDYNYNQYTCNSWLLSPALKPLLSEDSHILAFQHRFSVIQEDKDAKEYIEWLFHVPIHTDTRCLPEVTSLQKKVKQLLLNGKTIGSACGIIRVS